MNGYSVQQTPISEQKHNDERKQAEKTNSLPSVDVEQIFQILTELTKYNSTELYRLVVDGRFHKKQQGWVGYYQREPHSIEAVLNSLALAITNLEDTNLTEEYIIELHKRCIEKVEGLTDADATYHGRAPTYFELEPGNTTLEGLHELIGLLDAEFKRESGCDGPYIDPKYKPSIWRWNPSDEAIVRQDNDHGSFYNPTSKKLHKKLQDIFSGICQGKKCTYVVPRPRSDDFFSKKINDWIKIYNAAIKAAKEIVDVEQRNEAVLAAMVDFIYKLAILHPFGDANGRTFVNVLLNRLLIQNGFLPATFENPNVFFGHSKKQIILKVKEAIQNTKKIIDGEEKIFGFRSSEIPKKMRVLYPPMIANFLQTLKKETARFKKLIYPFGMKFFFSKMVAEKYKNERNEATKITAESLKRAEEMEKKFHDGISKENNNIIPNF